MSSIAQALRRDQDYHRTMPELPEVEIVRRTLLRQVAGRRLGEIHVRTARLRAPVQARALRRALPGRRILGIRRRGKYLLFDLEGGSVLLLHLGMSGRLTVVGTRRRLEDHDHVLFSLDRGQQIRFNDPRRFGLVDLVPAGGETDHPRLRHLGIEPLGDRFQAPCLWRAARGRRRPVKTFLMDATEVAGIGNIYASEALHHAGVHPMRAVGRLSLPRWEHLIAAVRTVLTAAIEGGGTTLSDFRDARGRAGAFSGKLQVYGREGQSCQRCRGRVRQIVQAGRSTFYCPVCQR
ncbi:MAG: bifunctional DNA-formamidopyrimidine glycosylase/DNA-(apurinic or apyrimidinic site) lyase [Acidobacteriota bacterium]